MPAIDLSPLRSQFPALALEDAGRSAVFFDGPGGTQVPQSVIDAMGRYLARTNANHGGAFRTSRESDLILHNAHQGMADFLNAASADEIVFGANMTTLTFALSRAIGRELQPGDEVLITKLDHDANRAPWLALAERDIVIKEVDFDPADCTLRLDPSTSSGTGLAPSTGSGGALADLLSPRTRVVAVGYASNAVGTVNPIARIAEMAHSVGAWLWVDAVHYAPHGPIDVQALGCDFFALSGHKMLGPTGSGVLYGKRALLEAMPPFLGGGEMIREVTATGFRCNDLPYKFEAGTPAIAEAIGLGVAVDYLQHVGLDKIRQHEREVTAYVLERMAEFPEITIYGPRDASLRSGLVAFTMGDIHPHDMATFLDEDGIAIRAGHHCAQPLHKHLGLSATSRASFYLYNTRAEIDVFVEALRKVKKFFGACPTGRRLGF